MDLNNQEQKSELIYLNFILFPKILYVEKLSFFVKILCTVKCTVLASYKNLPDLIERCNRELKKIANWMLVNKLAVNVSKCKFIIFHNRGKNTDMGDLTINFNQNIIGENETPDKIIPLDRITNKNADICDQSYKYLGILLDENFTLNAHFDSLSKKLSRGLFCLRRAKNLVDGKSLRSLYFALFHSHLTYCPLILACSSTHNIKRILLLQKKAIRLISKAEYNASTNPLFLANKILPFDKILYAKKMMFMHDIIHSNSLPTFKNYLKSNSDRNNGRELRNNDDITIPPPQI